METGENSSAAGDQQEIGMVFMSGKLDGQGIMRDCIRQVKQVIQDSHRRFTSLAQKETLSPADVAVMKEVSSEISALDDLIHHWNDVAISGSSETTHDNPNQNSNQEIDHEYRPRYDSA